MRSFIIGAFSASLILVYPILFTSWQDLTAVLQGERCERVLLVDPDHPMTEPGHGEDAPAGGVGALPTRSPDRDGEALGRTRARAHCIWP